MLNLLQVDILCLTYTETERVTLDDLYSCRYDCTKGRRKRSLRTLFERLVGRKEKEKKCDSVPVRHCPTVAKERPVVKCEEPH